MTAMTGVDQLALLADRSLHLLDPGIHHWLIRVIVTDTETESGHVEIGLCPLEDIADHPTDFLLGFVAPDEWWAIGIAATGSAYDIGDFDDEEPWDSLVVALVDRSGSSAGTVRRLGGAQPGQVSQAEGPMLDLCRRAIGLPTPPPEEPLLDWWARQWLNRLFMAALVEPTRRWTWADAVALHPMHLPVSSSGGSVAEYGFAAEVDAMGGQTDWAEVRRVAAGHPDGWLARWMDDGCYARWLLDRHSPADAQLEDLGLLLPSRLLDRLTGVLAAWDLLP